MVPMIKTLIFSYLFKPFIKEELVARLHAHFENLVQKKQLTQKRDTLEHKLHEQYTSLFKTQEATIHVIGSLAEYRVPETGNHTRLTQLYAELLGKAILAGSKYKADYDLKWLDKLCHGTPLHDLGKVAIADHILLKPGKLTDEEFEEMKTHAIRGRDALLEAEKMLGEDNFLKVAAEIAVRLRQSVANGTCARK